MSGNVLHNCKDGRTATPRYPSRFAIDGCPDIGRDYESGMVEAYGFLSNLSSQFYGFRQ